MICLLQNTHACRTELFAVRSKIMLLLIQDENPLLAHLTGERKEYCQCSQQRDDLGVSMKKKWWSSLQIKIIAWSFVPTVIILSAVAWFTFYSYQKVIGDLAMKQDLEILN
jgi:hypothetical protein